MHGANRGKCQLIASNFEVFVDTDRAGWLFFFPHLDASPTKPRARTRAQVCVAAEERADAQREHKHAQVAFFVEKTCLLVLLALTSPTFCQNRQRDSHQTCCVFPPLEEEVFDDSIHSWAMLAPQNSHARTRARPQKQVPLQSKFDSKCSLKRQCQIDYKAS